MKLLLVLLLVTFSFATQYNALKAGESWEEDIEILVDLGRHTWGGYMAELFYKEYDLKTECLGPKFTNYTIEMVRTMYYEDDIIIAFIKMFENMGHMYELTHQNCDPDRVFDLIDEQCTGSKCDWVKMLFRIESHMTKLLKLYDDIWYHLNKYYKDVEEAEIGFEQIGDDLAKGTHIVLGMKE